MLQCVSMCCGTVYLCFSSQPDVYTDMYIMRCSVLQCVAAQCAVSFNLTFVYTHYLQFVAVCCGARSVAQCREV